MNASKSPEQLPACGIAGSHTRLESVLVDTQREAPDARLRTLVAAGLGTLPLPGGGETLHRWRQLAQVASVDVPLVKLFEGHSDALAILSEASIAPAHLDATYGMWAAEAPNARVRFTHESNDWVMLDGTKAWCSGARGVDRALLTVWSEDGTGPWLADVALNQVGISFDDQAWKAIGMSSTGTADVHFKRVRARLIGGLRFYLSRPGFWQGGIGIAACWHGAASAVAEALLQNSVDSIEPGWHRHLALGDIDRVLSANAALLREAAAWVDEHPRADARAWAYRTRASSDEAAQVVLRAATRAMGAGPMCRDERFARLSTDLPVFIRQCHADRDLVALGAQVRLEGGASWAL